MHMGSTTVSDRKLTDHKVRAFLGRIMYDMFRQNVSRDEFDIERVAPEIGVSVDRVDAEARLLKKLKYA